MYSSHTNITDETWVDKVTLESFGLNGKWYILE